MSKRKPQKQSALEVVGAAADKLRSVAGQAWSDPLIRAQRLLDEVQRAADEVVEGKQYYYEQDVDNEDARDLALTLWADRVDRLDRALSAMRDVQ